VAVYRSTSTTLSDKNVVPDAVQLVNKKVYFDIQQGTPEARDEALVIGIKPALAAVGLTPVENETILNDRDVLLTRENKVFLIVSEPEVRKEGDSYTDHVRVMLMLSKKRPDGLPANP
jgi:hypothetical protein